jgi:hypothetical protein
MSWITYFVLTRFPEGRGRTSISLRHKQLGITKAGFPLAKSGQGCYT